MSLRRRLFLVSLVYLAVVVVGGALVLRISTQRDDLVTQQRALVAAAPLDNAQQAELSATQNRLEDLRIQLNARIETFGMMNVVIACGYPISVTSPGFASAYCRRTGRNMSGPVRQTTSM